MRCYRSRIFKFNKATNKIQEIYDFKGLAIPRPQGVFAIYKQNLYIISDVSHGAGSSGIKQFISIDLKDNKANIIRDDLSLSFYDNIGKNIITTIVDYDKAKQSLTIFDLNNSLHQINLSKSFHNQFYGINGTFIYFSGENTISVAGKNRYLIDLTKYVSGTINSNYTNLLLSDNYSVIALVYLEGQSQPEKYKINIKTGKVTKIEVENNDILNSNYLYVK